RQQQNQSRRKQRNQQYHQQVHQDPELAKFDQGELQYWTRRYPNQPPVNFNTMNMTPFTKLTKLSVKGDNHFIREPEINWMIQHWPALRELEGVSSSLKQYLFAHRGQQ
ncbi:hypothetical protein BGZ47_002211, partial [Haplosporangium gracile]